MLKFGTMATLGLGLTTAVSAATIPLRSGDYGAAGSACDNQPNATIVSFDGRRFSWPHATKCEDVVTGPSHGVFHVVETCRALGDGTPARPTTERFRIRVDAGDRFRLDRAAGGTVFRRCGPSGWFDRH